MLKTALLNAVYFGATVTLSSRKMSFSHVKDCPFYVVHFDATVTLCSCKLSFSLVKDSFLMMFTLVPWSSG